MTRSSIKPSPHNRRLSAPIVWFVVSNSLLGVLFGFFAYTAWMSWQANGHIQSLLLAFQELLIVGLTITRRRSIVETRSPWDWFVAFVGTAAPLLQRPAPTLPALEPIGLLLQFLGALLATVAVASLGRSFGIVAANRGVRTK
jgi:hypothetical protein